MWPFKKRKAERKTGNQAVKRSFAAAAISRLTASWTTTSQSIDWDLYRSLEPLRARSRDLCTNNAIARKFLQMCSTHVVGPNGFSYQVRVTETDRNGTVRADGLASDAIEKEFWNWMKRGNCDVTEKLSFQDIQNLAIKSLARDGEVLIRKIYGEQGGRYGFRLQILDVDRLDVNKNDEVRGGGRIKMGVEIDRVGKPVAYWLRERHPGDTPYSNYNGAVYERIPAADVYHLFIPERPEQTRGIPWLHSVMIDLENLGGYQTAAVIASRYGAAKMGFYVSPDGDLTALGDDKDDGGNIYSEADPGQFGMLPPGYDFKTYDPTYPHQMYPEFIKATLRVVASGAGVAYNTLSNDLEGVNFSSIRTGVLEERDNWMVVQNWLIENFLNDVFSTWLRMALLMGAIKLPNGSALPAAKFDKFNACTWQGRRWQWVDPVKDIEANVIAINNGLKSRADVVAEQGRDFDETLAALAAEQEKISAAGVMLESQQPASAAPVDNGGQV